MSQKATRRTFVAGVGATAAAVAVPGSAAAQTSAIDWGSDFAHESVLDATTVVDSVDLSRMSELEYEDDTGTVRDLTETHGARLRPRPETEDDVVEAHNPVTYSLSDVESGELSDFPRETYELDTDGNPDEDAPVAWTDATYWATSGATVTEGEGSLTISGTDGSATFSMSEWSLTEDERRHVLATVLDVNSLSSGGVVTLRASSSSGAGSPAEFVIDDAGDPEADDVIATTTATGVLYQSPLGDVEPGVEDVDEVTVDISGTADITIHGLSLDRTTVLDFGEREVVETDDDGNESLATERVEAHDGGPLSITSLSTIPSPLSEATLRSVEFTIRQRARDLPADLSASGRLDTPTGYDQEDRYVIGTTHKLPAAYDLDHTVESVSLRGALPSSRYFAVGYSTPSTSPESIEDYQDLSLTPVESQLDPTAEDPEVTLVDSIIASDGIDVVVDMALATDETSALTSGGSMGVGFLVGASGGDDDDGFLSPIRSVILMIAGIVGGAVAWSRGKVGA